MINGRSLQDELTQEEIDKLREEISRMDPESQNRLFEKFTPVPIDETVKDPEHRVGQLLSHSTPLISATPDEPIESVSTKMLLYDYSQLPVMQGERSLKGMVSWKSIGRAVSLKRNLKHARDCMDNAQLVQDDDPLEYALRLVAEHDVVFVRDGAMRICGVVTAHDLAKRLEQLSAPFLLLHQIEVQLRQLLASKFSIAELTLAVMSFRKITEFDFITLDEMTFGEYALFLQNAENWEKFDLSICRTIFLNALDEVRKTRNEVMHFRISELGPEQITPLVNFSKMLRHLIVVRKLSNV